MSAITCKGNAGTNSRSIFVNPPDPNHHSRFGYFSKGINFVPVRNYSVCIKYFILKKVYSNEKNVFLNVLP